MTLKLTNPEGMHLGPGDDESIPFEQMANFAENAQDRCPIILVVDVSSSMRDDVGMLNDAIEKFRQTVLEDPVATLRVEVSLVAFNHEVVVRQEFCPIDEFDPGPLVASGGTRLCRAVELAVQMVEDRKETYRENGVGYYRPWMFILTDGMTADHQEIDAIARRVREIEKANGLTTFAVVAGQARHDGAMEQLKMFTNRVQPMKDAAYEDLLEWMANSTVAKSNSGIGERIKMEDPSAWLEVET